MIAERLPGALTNSEFGSSSLRSPSGVMRRASKVRSREFVVNGVQRIPSLILLAVALQYLLEPGCRNVGIASLLFAWESDSWCYVKSSSGAGRPVVGTSYLTPFRPRCPTRPGFNFETSETARQRSQWGPISLKPRAIQGFNLTIELVQFAGLPTHSDTIPR